MAILLTVALFNLCIHNTLPAWYNSKQLFECKYEQIFV